MKKFIVLGLLALGTFAFANTNKPVKEVVIEEIEVEEDVFCRLSRTVRFIYADGSGYYEYTECLD